MLLSQSDLGKQAPDVKGGIDRKKGSMDVSKKYSRTTGAS
jgi:hypothetical protein